MATGVMTHLIGKLTTLMGDEYRRLRGFRRQLSFLEKEFSAMNAALQKLELVDELDPADKDWRDHVTKMAPKMENCIDDILRHLEHLERKDAKGGFLKETAKPLERLRHRHRITARINELKTLAIEANARRKNLTMNGQNALRRRKSHGVQHPRRGLVLQEITTDLTAGSVNINPERGSVLPEIAEDWTDDSVNIQKNGADGACTGNGEDYVSDDFVAEAMHKMQAVARGIDDLRNNSQRPTIHRVPTDHNSSYENDGIKPVAVRIGLLNWSEQDESKEKLRDYKWHCVQQLINLHSSVREPARTPLLLRKCLNSMIHIESEIRRFYSGVDVILMDRNRLALMMLLDGCFILHRLLKYGHLPENQADKAVDEVELVNLVSSTERLYGSPEEWELVNRDLLLFENQIPFLVLRKLLDKLEIDDEGEHNLVKGSLRLFRSNCSSSWMLRSEFSESDMACDQVHHLLHLFYLSVAMPPRPSDQAPHVCLSVDPQWIFCTKELEEAGVRFRKRESVQSFLDIEFDSDHGFLEIPPLLLDESSVALFRNLIAFEKSYTNTRQCISNYAAFMGDLLKTPEDMQILRQHDILVNVRDTSSFFNVTRTRMHLASDNHLLEVMENLKRYKGSRRHEWRAELMRNHFRNPWVAIPGTIMLSMTVLQTFFTVYGYFFPRK